MKRLSLAVNDLAIDDRVKQGSGASTALLLAYFFRDIPVPTPEWLIF